MSTRLRYMRLEHFAVVGRDGMDELKNYSTKELVEELSNREGVERTDIKPYELRGTDVEGPAVVLIIMD